MGEALKTAYERLTVPQICEAAGRPLDLRGDSGLCTSPFPELHANGDKNASFQVHSVSAGRTWENLAGNWTVNKGGLLELAKLLHPRMSLSEVRSWLVQVADTGHLDTGPTGGATSKKPSAATLEAQRRRRVEQASEALWAMPSPLAKAPAAAPAVVRDRYFLWAEGMDAAAERLAEERGWPLEWVHGAIAQGGLKRPLLRWYDRTDQKYAAGGWAFPVVCPAAPCSGSPDAVFLGYHQRYRYNADKGWLYVPSKLKKPPRSQLETQLAARYADWPEGQRIVPPLPFVVGDLAAPKLVVILEGQWDALTAYGALGGFVDADPMAVAVFGLRGCGTQDWFFKGWGAWLSRRALDGLEGVWVLGDGDAGGERVYRSQHVTGQPEQPSFANIMRRNIRTKVVAGRIQKYNDFNDYYKARKPEPEQLWEMLTKLGLAK